MGRNKHLYVIKNWDFAVQKYQDEILEPIVLPYAVKVRQQFAFMHNNVRPYRETLLTTG